MTTDDFNALRAEIAESVESALDALLPRPPAVAAPAAGDARLFQAMRHAVLGGGKRLRGFMVVSSARLFGVSEQRALRAAAAVECLHAYSLVHDDLPCMDDDDLRRGRPTVHVAYDEATAVLAGDALQALAFEIVADEETHESPWVRADLALHLARAAGGRGMVAGQALDIAAESAAQAQRETEAANAGPAQPAGLSLAQIIRLQTLKTGALFEFACASGAILGKAGPSQRRALSFFAREFGKAYQIKDDLLDVEGDQDAVGKRLGKDARAGKATFVTALGVEAARAQAHMLVEQAIGHLEPFGPAGAPLAALARFAVRRDR